MNVRSIGALFTISLLLAVCCAPRRTAGVFNDPHYYYDEKNYTLIRVNPETREQDIKRYKEQSKKTIFKYHATKPQPDTAFLQDTPPRPKKRVKPKYPQELVNHGYSGKVNLKLLLDENGVVIQAQPASGGRKLDAISTKFIKASLEAAIHTEFYPARHEGEPVKVWVTYPIQFIIVNGTPSRPFPANLVP